MPEPEYQRELGCCELSTRTAITFDAPSWCRYGVSSYWKELYPYGRLPRYCPLIQTSLFRYTPSNSTNTTLPVSAAATENVLRYQPTPPGSAPPATPAGFVSLNSPSMLQSCGTSSVRQPESAKATSWAPTRSPRWKCHPRSKLGVLRWAAPGHGASSTRRAINGSVGYWRTSAPEIQVGRENQEQHDG